MSKLSNQWDYPLTTWIPYLQWSELEKGKLDIWDSGRHNHAFFELHIITQGACSLLIENLEVPLKKGQGIVIAPEAFHGPLWASEQFRRFSVSFHIADILLGIIEPRHFAVFEAGEEILTLCEQICSELQTKEQFFHKEMLSGQFSQLMIYVLRMLQDAPHAEEAIDLRQNEDMLVIDDFFSTMPMENCTKKALSQRLHCSERQLLRKIYTLYGVSFREKLALARIDMAKHLLRSTTMHMDDISASVGYADNAAFYRVFRANVGVTPREYRKNTQRDD